MENRHLNKIKQIKSLAKGIRILQMVKNAWAGRLHATSAHSCCSALFSLYFVLQSCQRSSGPWWCTMGSAVAAGQASSPSSSSSQHLQCWQWPSCWSWRGSRPSYTPCVCTGMWRDTLELFPDQSLGGNSARHSVRHAAPVHWIISCLWQMEWGRLFQRELTDPCSNLLSGATCLSSCNCGGCQHMRQMAACSSVPVKCRATEASLTCMTRPKGSTAMPLALYPTQGSNMTASKGSKSSAGTAKPGENLGLCLCHQPKLSFRLLRLCGESVPRQPMSALTGHQSRQG